MVKLQKVRELVIGNRFRNYRYVNPLPEAPFRFFEQIEKLHGRYPILNRYEEFERNIVDYDFGFGEFSLDVTSDECNDSIEADISILGLYGVNYKFYKRKLKYRLPPPPVNQPFKAYVTPHKPVKECNGFLRRLYIIHITETTYYDEFPLFNNEIACGWIDSANKNEILQVTFGEENEYEMYNGRLERVYARIKTRVKTKQTGNQEYIEYYQPDNKTDLIDQEDDYEVIHTIYDDNKNKMIGFGGGFVTANYGEYIRTAKFLGYDYSIVGSTSFNYQTTPSERAVVLGADDDPIDGETETSKRTIQHTFSYEYPDSFGNRVAVFDTNVDYFHVVKTLTCIHKTICESGDTDYSPKKKPFKPPPPPRRMKCCPDNSALLKTILKLVRENNILVKENHLVVTENNAIVRQNNEVIKEVDKTVQENNEIVKDNNEIVKENKKRIGVLEYPVSVPKSLINVNGKEQGNKNVENLTQLLAWYVERFDEVVGQFEIPIEIEDADLTKEGNQKLEVKLPNIAESIAEMFTMLLNLNIVNEVQMNMNTRLLAEMGADKQQNFKSYMALEAIVEFLGFSYRDATTKLPLTFTPGAEELSDILKEKEIDVSYIDYDDKINLPKQMQELLQSAAIIRSVHWRNFKKSGNMASQIKDLMINNKDLFERMLKGLDLEKLEKEINEIKKQQDKP
ncbi:MAG: hypothetical protein WBA41_17275 [Rivularia sp. (in: cyanobacteria)]